VRSDILPFLAVTLLLAACEDNAAPKPVMSRFASVKSQQNTAVSGFCEQSFPASGATARKLVRPALREVPGLSPQARSAGRWTWLNLWATWCAPCMEEMALLGRWKESLAKDGVDVELELLSVDGEEADLKKALESHTFPGQVEWLGNPAELTAFVETLGIPKQSPIPIHALVDPAGMVRCVRVGSVHDRDYGSVKTLLGAR